jgi:hypothetical protein
VQQEGFSPGAFLRPLLMDSHSPHACSTPGICNFIVPQSIGCSTSPLRVSVIGQIKNYHSYVASDGLSLRENHFPANSLTWRELLTGLTTCLFNHGPDNLLLQLSSNTVRTKARLRKEQMMTESHTQSRIYMATTTNSYDTTWLRKLRGAQTSWEMRISPWFSLCFRMCDPRTKMQRSMMEVSGSDGGRENERMGPQHGLTLGF